MPTDPAAMEAVTPRVEPPCRISSTLCGCGRTGRCPPTGRPPASPRCRPVRRDEQRPAPGPVGPARHQHAPAPLHADDEAHPLHPGDDGDSVCLLHQRGRHLVLRHGGDRRETVDRLLHAVHFGSLGERGAGAHQQSGDRGPPRKRRPGFLAGSRCPWSSRASWMKIIVPTHGYSSQLASPRTDNVRRGGSWSCSPAGG